MNLPALYFKNYVTFFPLAKTRWKIQWQGYVTTNLEVVIILCLILTTSLEYLKDHTHTLLLSRVIMGVTHVYCCLTFKNTLLTKVVPRLPFHIKNLPNNLFCIYFYPYFSFSCFGFLSNQHLIYNT